MLETALPPARRLAAGWARQRALALVAHARAHAPFWRERLAGWQPGDGWQALPPVGKRELMRHFDDAVTDRRLTLAGARAFIADPERIGDDHLGRYALWTSSGTTGEPGLFAHDGQALATYATLMAMRGEGGRIAAGLWASLALADGCGVLLAATHGHYAGISFWRRQCRLQPWLRGRARTLAVTRPLAELTRELDALAPAFVSSYPSMLAELAEAQQQGRLHIRPRALWAGGEALSEPVRTQVEAAFGAPVANDYGSSEMLVIAHECAVHRLHVNDDWVILEPVDAHGRPVPAGTASHSVLITNLANQVQPLIRYDLGDSITMLPGACPCGDTRPAITVQGRCDDVLQFADANGQVRRLSPMAVATVVEHAIGLTRFQVRQTAPDLLQLRLAHAGRTAGRRDEAAALAALRALLAEHGLGRVRVRADPQPPRAEPHSGKLRQVVRELAA